MEFKIGLRIKERREALKLTQEELATRMGYKDKSSIHRIEAGRADIPQSKVYAFAKALDTTPVTLWGGGTTHSLKLVFLPALNLSLKRHLFLSSGISPAVRRSRQSRMSKPALVSQPLGTLTLR